MSDTRAGAKYSKTKERRFYRNIRARDPHDLGEWEILISPDFYEYTQKRGMGKTREFVDIVRQAVLNPRKLFRGIRDDEVDVDDDDWLCYVATPSHAYNYRTGDKCPVVWDKSVMLVYVTDERVLYNWYWADPTSFQAQRAI